jgi:small subunit ribosomal protein S6
VSQNREYETVFILDPALEEGPVNEQIDRASTLIQDNGGTVAEVERWGRRRLAYEIGRKRDGVYTLLRYHAPGTAVKELERRLRLNEQVLRVQTVIVDPRYKEMLEAMANAPVPVVAAEDSEDDERPRRRGRPEQDD